MLYAVAQNKSSLQVTEKKSGVWRTKIGKTLDEKNCDERFRVMLNKEQFRLGDLRT